MDQGLIDEVLAERGRAFDDARPHAVEAAHARGELTARERIAALIDEGSFVEYGVLAEASPDDPGNAPADGAVCGSALLCGRPVLVAGYDRAVYGGTQSDRNQRKLERLLFLAYERRWPFVCFAAGDGARVLEGAGEGRMGSAGGRFGLFDGLAELSGWVPTVAVLSGRSLAGNVSLALMSDFVVATRGAELGGPTLHDDSRSADYHEGIGDIDLVVEDDRAAVDAVRRYLAYYLLDLPAGEPSPAAASIRSIVPDNRRRAYDMRKVIDAVSDDGSVLELRPNWARSMLTAFARLDGRSVGIFANQPQSPLAGAIDPDAADKLCRFVELCDAYEFPLVSFVDNPGFMVGPDAERAGIARHHARPLMALHHRTVPLYSVQIRKAYGLGPFAMSGYGHSRLVPDLRLAWPSVESGGMSLEGAAYLVRRREILAAETPAEARRIRDEYASTVREMNSGLKAGRNYSFDDIVDPAETRDRIISLLRRTPRRLPDAKKHAIDTV